MRLTDTPYGLTESPQCRSCEHMTLVSKIVQFTMNGSFGNGASMRVAPLGAFFADMPDDLVENAALSAQVTHHHPEATAGAIAVAMGTALASEYSSSQAHDFHSFIENILEYVPDSMTKEGITIAFALGPDVPVEEAARKLGSGYEVTTQDTVPFVIWCASAFMGDYEEALWHTVRGGGDMDTTCAMVGGIVVMSTGIGGIPEEWHRRREPLPDLPFEE